MLSEQVVEDAARRLDSAEKTCTQVRQFSLEFPEITIDDAYNIQQAWIALKLGAGRSIKGHKIGLTSRAMQQSSNIGEPDYGALLDDMFFASGAELPSSRFIVPRLEVELGFVLAKPLAGPGCTIFDALNAIDYVVPAVEIIDARIQQADPETGQTRKVMDTISDNAAGAALVMGGRPFKPLETDLRWAAAVCYRNGIVEESGVAAAVLNHPANGVAWLANKLARHNVSLAAGEFILGGSFTRPVQARRGDTFHIDYGKFGSISCYFA